MNRFFTVQYSEPYSYEQVKEWADTSPLIENWRFELPYSMFVVSAEGADSVARDFRRKLGTAGRFVVTPMTGAAGWMSKGFWQLYDETGKAGLKPTTRQ